MSQPNRPGPGKRVVRPGFHARVHAVVRQVPRGRVATFGDVAQALGRRSVARHVGYALAALAPDGDEHDQVPWYRIVNARGAVSCRGDGAPSAEQIRRLRAEGIRVDESGRIAGFAKVRIAAERLSSPPA